MKDIREKSILPAAFIIVLAGVVLTFALHRPPKALPENAPPAKASAARAMKHVKALASQSRPTGSPGHERGFEYIVSQLTSMGVTPETKELFHVEDGKAYYLRNIIAVLKGADTNLKAVCLAAHYDSVPFGPGAADDAAGCAVLLETMRALKQHAVERDVVFLFADGEEGYSPGSGTKGAMLFAESHPLMSNIGFVLNYDCRGSRGPVYMYETGPSNASVIPILASSGVRAFTSSLMASIYGSMPLGSDFTRFANKGVSGWNFAFTDRLQHYHTARDTPENLSIDTLEHSLDYTAGILSRLNASFPRASAELHYFDIAGLVVVHYPSFISPLLTIGGWMALAFLVFLYRKRLDRKAIFASFAGSIGVFTVITGITLIIAAVLYLFRSFYLVYSSVPIAIGLYLTAFGVYLRFAKSDRASAVAFSFVWGVLSVVFLFFMPGGNYLFVWPFIGSIMLFAVDALGNEQRIVPVLVRAIIAFAVILLWGGILLALHETLTCIFVFLTAGVFSLLCGFFVPFIGERQRVPAAVASLVFGALLAAGGTVFFRFSAEEPRFTSLVYTLDRDTGNAAWYSALKSDAWTSRVIPPGSAAKRVDAFVPYEKGVYPSANAPVVRLPEYSLSGARAGDVTRMTIRYRDYDYIVLIDDGGTITEAFLDGRQLPFRDGKFILRIIGRPSVDPVLTVRAAGAVRLRAIAHRYTLPENAGLSPMPPDMMMLCNTPDFNKRLLKSGETMEKKTFVCAP